MVARAVPLAPIAAFVALEFASPAIMLRRGMDLPLVRTPRADADLTRRLVSAALFDGMLKGRAWLESRLLRPAQVAALLQVSRRTVAAWARAGRLPSIATPGGHRRFRASDVYDLVESLTVIGDFWSASPKLH